MSQVRALTEQPTAVRRTLLIPEQLADWVPSACAVVAEHLRHHGIAPIGFPYARCHSLPDGLVEAEAGFPVAAPIADSGVVVPSTLPGGPVLVFWHTDPDEKPAQTYQAIEEWLQAEGAVATGDSWEVYHDLPSCDQVGTRIEIIQPISFCRT
ncbi:GyrI-like domain-containing protein [Kribbella sp. NPDC000426]|uniref:GyrI-like domain-containing protein n=1 Tax=Kribbella sp. NPDC000426 TaxID=3154255 RepID=UPI0033167193